MVDVSALTNGKLVKLIEGRDSIAQGLVGGVFSLAKSHDDRFGDIIRENPDSPPVVAYEKALGELHEAKAEARRRVGPVQFDMTSTLITYLQNQKGLRRRRIR